MKGCSSPYIGGWSGGGYTAYRVPPGACSDDLCFNYPLPDRVPNDPRRTPDFQSFLDGLPMKDHGLGAKTQTVCDLLRGKVFSDEFRHLDLSRGKLAIQGWVT